MGRERREQRGEGGEREEERGTKVGEIGRGREGGRQEERGTRVGEMGRGKVDEGGRDGGKSGERE